MLLNQTISVASPILTLASFVFNGSGIWLQGTPDEQAKLNYGVILDQDTYTYVNFSSSSDILFGMSRLSSSSEHRIAVNPSKVVSSVVVEMDIDATTQLFIDDAQLFGTPPSGTTVQTQGSWVANSCIGTGQYDGTCHTSSDVGDWFSFTFEGDAITVYGAVTGSQSQYSISIDGSAPTTYQGISALTNSSVPLALASNLGLGTHTITIANTASNAEGSLEIDYILLWTDNGATTASGSSSADETLGKSTRIGLIVGTILGCVFIAFAWMLYLLYRQRADGIKAATAKLLDNDTWNFSWKKKGSDAASVADSDTSTLADEKHPATPNGTTAIPVLARVPPSHHKTTSFDAPWLETAPPPQPSFHPFSEDDAPPTNRWTFMTRFWGH